MKLKLISTVIAASFLAGCSSSDSSNDEPGSAPQSGVADVTYMSGENLSVAYIAGDEGNKAAIIENDSGTHVRVGGETYYIVDGIIYDNTLNEKKVGEVSRAGDYYTITGEHGAVLIVTVENGRLHVVGQQDPIDPEFGEPKPGIGDGMARLNVVQQDNGTYSVVLDGEEIGSVRITPNGTPIFNSPDHGIKKLDNVEVIRIGNDESNKVVNVTYTNNETGVKYTWTPESGISSESIDNLPSSTKQQRNELKQNIQSLSQEQRQQIKQAVKDRVGRS
jgi:hypothetical protein